MPSISVIIPAYTKEYLSKKCLETLALSAKEGNADFDVILVDNAAGIQRPEEEKNAGSALAAYGREVLGQRFLYIPMPENRNFAGACNRGAQASGADFLFFLNNDTKVEKNWWHLAFFLEKEKTLGAAGPLLLFPPDETGRRHIQHLGITFDPSLNPCHIYEGFLEDHPVATQKRPLQAITGAAFMVRRTLFEELGCFDEAYRNGYEDLDFCARLKERNLGVSVFPSVCIEHACGQSPGRNAAAAENRALFLQKAGIFTPDFHTLLVEDGYTFSLTPWATWQPELGPSRKQELEAKCGQHTAPQSGQGVKPGSRHVFPVPPLQEADTLLLCLEQEPFWLEGHLAFLDFCLAHRMYEALFAHASRYYPFDSTPQIMQRVLAAAFACGFAPGDTEQALPRIASQALYETARQAALYAEKILHVFIQPFEAREKRFKEKAVYAQQLNIPCAFENLDLWRETEYQPFLRTLIQLSFFRMPPLSGLVYDVWQEVVEPSLALPNPSPGLWPQLPDTGGPLFSILMPVYNPDPVFFEAALASCLAQTYPYFEICVADDASTNPAIASILHSCMEQDSRLKVVFRKENGHICAASQSALKICAAPWVVLVDHDDVLPPHALMQVALTLAQCAAKGKTPVVLFSDEDRLDEHTGKRTSPFFKAGFDPVLLLACNCVSHLGVFRADVLRNTGFRAGFEGSQDYDLVLRILQTYGAEAFVHIPQILYHWRQHPGSTSSHVEAKPYAREASKKAKEDFLSGYGALPSPRGYLSPRPGSAFTEVHFYTPNPAPLLSCILPFNPADYPSPAAFSHTVARFMAQGLSAVCTGKSRIFFS